MLFNSLDFALFLLLVFIVYWLLQKYLRLQNMVIVIASYVFYGWWDWRFLGLIFLSTLIDFFVGIQLNNSKKNKHRWLGVSIFSNLGLLLFFKYCNFFIDNFINAFTFFGAKIQPNTLDIILPVGISFYTFQTLSYTIDIYRKKIKPTQDFIAFMAFVSFFPQLVAGPIERATNLLPQFFKRRNFEYADAVNGMRQILWGLFKKVVIADQCAELANFIFENYQAHSGSALVCGAIFFAFQIYGDFSGYSDIAIGTARLFGFNLMENFAFPYFSRDIAEFWRRWHISLSTWFRDYVYIPLGGSRGNTRLKIRNTCIIFLVSGFWHGANWTFIFWGLIHAIYFLPLLLSNNNRKNTDIVAKSHLFPSAKEILQMGFTFSLVVFAWIFFRAETLTDAMDYITHIFKSDLFSLPYITEDGTDKLILPKIIWLVIAGFVSVEWIGRKEKYALAIIDLVKYQFLRWVCYIFLCFAILLCQKTTQQEFIYFQF